MHSIHDTVGHTHIKHERGGPCDSTFPYKPSDAFLSTNIPTRQCLQKCSQPAACPCPSKTPGSHPASAVLAAASRWSLTAGTGMNSEGVCPSVCGADHDPCHRPFCHPDLDLSLSCPSHPPTPLPVAHRPRSKPSETSTSIQTCPKPTTPPPLHLSKLPAIPRFATHPETPTLKTETPSPNKSPHPRPHQRGLP